VVLRTRLAGVDLSGLALRTRSKVIKQHVCRALELAIPSSFKKTQPRFPCLDFDVYVQKSNNLQIWNEEVSPTRRYVVIRLDENDQVVAVRVILGQALALLDTTGTMTQKYQARLDAQARGARLLSGDTERLSALAQTSARRLPSSPTAEPSQFSLMPIKEVFEHLKGLVGVELDHISMDQERNRGAELHRVVTTALGYSGHADSGMFPDVVNQLLEVKLQTSPTIDLGLVLPSSTDLLDFPPIEGRDLRHCDVRYAVFPAVTDADRVRITGLLLVCGEKFFDHFSQFQGKVVNKKIQLPLPPDFFNMAE